MRIFKSILILVLLIGISIGVYGDTGLSSTGTTYVSWIGDEPKAAETLLEWFKNRTLDGKIEIYKQWKENEDKMLAGEITFFRTPANVPEIEKKIEKKVTYYAEFFSKTGDFGVMDVSIENVEPEKICAMVNNMEGLIGHLNIEWTSVDNGKINVHISITDEHAIGKLRELRDKLMKKGFEYKVN